MCAGVSDSVKGNAILGLYRIHMVTRRIVIDVRFDASHERAGSGLKLKVLGCAGRRRVAGRSYLDAASQSR